MDVRKTHQELHKNRAVHTKRKSLFPAEKKNGTTTTTTRRSPSLATTSRRCRSPNITRTATPPAQPAPKRAISAERKRPSPPPSPPSSSSSRPSTPPQDISSELQLGSRKAPPGSRLPESLWPSTMRSLSVSFQSDSVSVPVSKKDKPVTHALSDRTLKPSSNVAQKQIESRVLPRKSTPERKRSPLKGKNSSDQSENSRPLDSAQARFIDQHRWPSRSGGKLCSNYLNKSLDFTDKITRISSNSVSSTGIPSLRRLSAEGIPRPLHKSSSDASGQLFGNEVRKIGLNLKSVDDTLLCVSGLQKANYSVSIDRMTTTTSAVGSRSLPGSRLPSPGRTQVARASPSPSRTRPATATSSRGASPSRTRPSSPTRQLNTKTSVLSFIADIKKGKKGNQLEDAHQLRLLHNQHLQWRYANARADASLCVQKNAAEKALHNVWRTNLALWNSNIRQRINLHQLKLDLKLNLILNEQLEYLEGWELLERDHSTSLDGVIKDLEASTVQLPITGGAKANNEQMRAAMRSAIDVMQAMGSSICSVLSKVEGLNGFVSELAEVAVQEKAMLDECDAFLTSTSAFQVKEYSLRTQLIQLLH